MENIKSFCTQIINSKNFEWFITAIIIINSLLIGVQATHTSSNIDFIQTIILYIFTFEIIARYIAAENSKAFFQSGWNNFDLILVLIGWIPASLGSGSTMMALRVLRVFRVLRLLRAAEELKLIVSVLVKSLKSMFYNGLLFLIFIYLYAVAGVSLFRLPDPQQLSPTELQKYEQLMTEAPHSPVNSPDPFGTIGEAFFTLFRALTGEDWTDLRYNLVTASNLGVIDVNPSVITVFLVSWFCIAAFLLLNLVTGAVINNYQNSLAEVEERKKLKMKATESSPVPTGEPVAAEIEVEGSGN
ncbi:MAG: ion transporter [Bacteroidales bacterium]|nr:ion transporter [Bacteroidales bacterium]